jgi:hypothetical protein
MPTETNYGPTRPFVTPRHISWLVVSGRNWRRATESLMHLELTDHARNTGRTQPQATLLIRCTRTDLLEVAERVRRYLQAAGFEVPPVELVSGGAAMIEVVA